MREHKYVCSSCHYKTAKWLGKCPQCAQWNSFVEADSLSSVESIANTTKTLAGIKESQNLKLLTGLREFDRVLGHGLTKGSLNLIGGDPGVGKSTLILQSLDNLLRNNSELKALYISGEESLGQISNRCSRLKITNEKISFLHETSWSKILEQIKLIKPEIIVLDSMQTIRSSEVTSAAGTISQVKEVINELMTYAKNHEITCLVIGHMTKEGSLAGPKHLEHMVDSVLYFEVENESRVLRCVKNRFGSTREVGLFKLDENGLSSQKLNKIGDSHKIKTSGLSYSGSFEGERFNFLEVQSLFIENKSGYGKKYVQGLDSIRLNILCAIAEKYMAIPFCLNDIYLSVKSRFKTSNLMSDLAIIASLISTHKNIIITGDILFMGEVTLSGEVIQSRLSYANANQIKKLGFNKIVGHISEKDSSDLMIHNIKNLPDFMTYLRSEFTT